MEKIKLLWDKYQVFILGLLGAISLALQSLLAQNPGSPVDLQVYAFAALMAILSFIATEWRGKGVTLTGILGTMAGVFLQMHQTGTFSWNQFVVYVLIAVLSAVAPPAKPASYELK